MGLANFDDNTAKSVNDKQQFDKFNKEYERMQDVEKKLGVEKAEDARAPGKKKRVKNDIKYDEFSGVMTEEEKEIKEERKQS